MPYICAVLCLRSLELMCSPTCRHPGSMDAAVAGVREPQRQQVRGVQHAAAYVKSVHGSTPPGRRR
jgi:hypothetical protein